MFTNYKLYKHICRIYNMHICLIYYMYILYINYMQLFICQILKNYIMPIDEIAEKRSKYRLFSLFIRQYVKIIKSHSSKCKYKNNKIGNFENIKNVLLDSEWSKGSFDFITNNSNFWYFGLTTMKVLIFFNQIFGQNSRVEFRNKIKYFKLFKIYEFVNQYITEN